MSQQILNSNLSMYKGKESRIFVSPTVENKNLDLTVNSLRELTNSNPYPDDFSLNSYKWITNIAISMDEIYNPDFMFLSYANSYYIAMNTPSASLEWEKYLEMLFFEVARFINQTGYVPIIIGTGGTCPLQGHIDLSYLEGQVNTNWPGLLYASVYNSTSKDLKLMQKEKSIQMIIPRERLRVMTEEPQELLPDYFLIARRGYAFSNRDLSPTYRVNARDAYIPVIAPQSVRSIHDISKLIKSLLVRKIRVALIVLEGISCEDFLWEYQICSNTYSWFTYLPEEFQYLTLTTGLKIPKFQIFSKFCSNYLTFENYSDRLALEGKSIGSKSSINSAAVGSRRILTRIASGADIVIEGG